MSNELLPPSSRRSPTKKTNKERQGHRLLRDAERSDRQAVRGARRQGISVITYSKNKEASMKFLEWFIREDVQKRWADLGGYTCNAAILKSDGFRKGDAVQRGFLPVDVHGEGLLGGS